MGKIGSVESMIHVMGAGMSILDEKYRIGWKNVACVRACVLGKVNVHFFLQEMEGSIRNFVYARQTINREPHLQLLEIQP